MRINVYYSSAAGEAELGRLDPVFEILGRRGHDLQVYPASENEPRPGDVHLALDWEAACRAAVVPTLHLIQGWEGLGADPERLGRIEQVYRDPRLFRAVQDQGLALFLEQRFGAHPVLLARGDHEAEALALEGAFEDMLRAASVRRRYARAIDLAWDAKVAEIGPASPWGSVLLAGPARQLTLACGPEQAEALGKLPKIRIGRGGQGPWGLERGAFDLVVHLAPAPAIDHAHEIAAAASLLGPGGTLVYGTDGPEALDAARKHFASVEKTVEGELVCTLKAAPAREEDEEKAMNQSSGWGFQPPIEAPQACADRAFPAAASTRADHDLDRLIQALGSSVSKVHLTAAQALICMGDYAGALNHAEAAVVFGGRDGEILNTLGWLRYMEKDDQGALVAFDEALGLTPEHPDVLYNKGMVCYSLGRREEAGNLWEASIRAGNGRPEVHNNLGVLRFAEGRSADAAALFQRALEIDPGYAEARENLAGSTREPAAGRWH